MKNIKLFLVNVTPWQLLRCLWWCECVERTTIFRWEMNAALGEWK